MFKVDFGKDLMYIRIYLYVYLLFIIWYLGICIIMYKYRQIFDLKVIKMYLMLRFFCINFSINISVVDI